MMRMLTIGYFYGIRSERRLYEEPRFNLAVHLHLLVPDGAYTFKHDKPRFRRAPAPSPT